MVILCTVHVRMSNVFLHFIVFHRLFFFSSSFFVHLVHATIFSFPLSVSPQHIVVCFSILYLSICIFCRIFIQKSYFGRSVFSAATGAANGRPCRYLNKLLFYFSCFSGTTSFLALKSLYISSEARRILATDALFFRKQK